MPFISSVPVARPDKASLRFMAEEVRRVVRMQFEAGNELADKAEAIVKANGILFGLILTALSLAKVELLFPQWVPGWMWPVALWAGPVSLFTSMLLASWAFRAVDFEIGLSADTLVQSLGYWTSENVTLTKAIESYAVGIKANKASINRVEGLVTWALVFLAVGSVLTLSAGLLVWAGHEVFR